MDALISEAFQLIGKEQYEDARERFERALPITVAEHAVLAEAECHRGLGLVHYNFSDYPAARDEFEKALALFTQQGSAIYIARVHQHLGSVALMMGEATKARSLYDQALGEYEQLGATRERIRLLANYAHLQSLPVDERVNLCTEGIELAAQSGDRIGQAQFLHTRADNYFYTGDLALAQADLRQAAAIYEEENSRGDLSRVYTSMGRLERAYGHLDRAIDFYSQAIKIQDAVGDKTGKIQNLNGLAFAYASLNNKKEGFRTAEVAMALARETGSQRVISFQTGNLTAFYYDAGDYARAASLLEEVLATSTERTLMPHRWYQLSAAYEGQGLLEKALAAADRAVVTAKNEGSAEYTPEGLNQRARVLEKLHQTNKAVADVREALAFLEQLRTKLAPADYYRRGFADRHQELFSFAIEVLTRAGNAEEALEIAEQGRARAFLDLVANRDLQKKITGGNGSIAGNPTRGGQRAQHSDIWTAFRDEGAGPQGTYARAANITEIKTAARRLGSTILAYWRTDDALYIWTVSPEGIIRQQREALAKHRLSELITTALDPAQESAAPWKALYDVLIAPVRNALPTKPGARLTIVPHGPLFLLPFAALQHGNRYLLEDYTLHYLPSISVLGFTSGSDHKARAAKTLVIADPELPARMRKSSFAPLPGAHAEAASINALLPRDTVTLVGGNATKTAVRQAIAGKSVIHFATHGVFRDREPMGSFLALSPSGKSDDGRLTAEEVYGLPLNADLVFLSACRTGVGNASGDGIVGLTRAFFYAGTRTVVASLTDTSDESSQDLVKTFYGAWVRGGGKSQSLRGAQLRLLRELRAGRVKVQTPAGALALPNTPRLWANYILVGEP